MSEHPQALLDLIATIANKRPRIVAEHILKHGFITTEELSTLYGYEHPPRAARDLREMGVPLDTFRVKNVQGKTIAAYRFGDVASIQTERYRGRKVFTRKLRNELLLIFTNRCAICNAEFEAQFLQIDHRIPYEVAGDLDSNLRQLTDFMPLCNSCNRTKSWSCEHCQNWLKDKQPAICTTCYWAHPESYKHIAMVNIRRVDLVWLENEISAYEQLAAEAKAENKTLDEFIKERLSKQP
jgi:hypothetical protein